MSRLIDCIKEILGALSSYKTKYEDEKKKREELEAEITEAIKLIEETLKDIKE